MRPALQLRLGTQLTLTPQLTQAIKLLAMSNLELNTELSTIIESNPVLEIDFDDAPETEANDISGPSDSDFPAVGQSLSEIREATTESPSEANSELSGDESPDAPAAQDDGGADLDVDTAELRDWGTTGSGSGQDDDDNDSMQQQSRAETTLREHLRWQLDLTPFSPRDRPIAEVLIDAVEDDGYLREPVDYQRAALIPDLIVSASEVETVRQRLMRFDPIGVLARSLPESLVVQLKETPHVRRTLAIDIVQNAFDQIARGDCDKLAKNFESESCEIAQALKLIRSLNPKPGAGFYVASDEYAIPDVEVRKRGNTWQVRLNPQAQPRLKISSGYESSLTRLKREDASYVRAQLADAKQLLKSLAQREDTVLRVAEAIVREQVKFFDHGVEYMKPLVLRHIAEMCDLHESTVSRVTTRKYMHTPRGLFEFKHFFSSGVSTRDGGEASSTAIQEMIRKLVDSEDGRKPLSDNALSDLLKARGVLVARRTVAKYREAMNVPSSQDRVRHDA